MFIVDSAAYCELADSILWDRSRSICCRSGRQVRLPPHGFRVRPLGRPCDPDARRAAANIRRSTPTPGRLRRPAFVRARDEGGAPHFKLTPNRSTRHWSGSFRSATRCRSHRTTSRTATASIGSARFSRASHAVRRTASAAPLSPTADSQTHGYTDADIYTGTTEGLSELLGELHIGSFQISTGSLDPGRHDSRPPLLQPFRLVEADESAVSFFRRRRRFDYSTDTNFWCAPGTTFPRTTPTAACPRSTSTGPRLTHPAHRPADFALGTMFAIAIRNRIAAPVLRRIEFDDEDGPTTTIFYASTYAKDVDIEEHVRRSSSSLSPPSTLGEATFSASAEPPLSLDLSVRARARDRSGPGF